MEISAQAQVPGSQISVQGETSFALSDFIADEGTLEFVVTLTKV